MDLTINKKETYTQVSINEVRLDALVSPIFKKKMEEIISNDGGEILLDISQLSFMDSSSLGAMVAVLKLTGKQGKMVVFGASGGVLELFKLTRMDSVFTLVDTIEEAESMFSVSMA